MLTNQVPNTETLCAFSSSHWCSQFIVVVYDTNTQKELAVGWKISICLIRLDCVSNFCAYRESLLEIVRMRQRPEHGNQWPSLPVWEHSPTSPAWYQVLGRHFARLLVRILEVPLVWWMEMSLPHTHFAKAPGAPINHSLGLSALSEVRIYQRDWSVRWLDKIGKKGIGEWIKDLDGISVKRKVGYWVCPHWLGEVIRQPEVSSKQQHQYLSTKNQSHVTKCIPNLRNAHKNRPISKVCPFQCFHVGNLTWGGIHV